MKVCGPPHLHVSRKRVCPVTAAAAATPKGTHRCLLSLVDVASSKQYLVYSGSSFSILPHKSSAEATRPHLMTADGKPLHCWGCHMCTVCTWTREFTLTFLLALVAFPILGADFLSNLRFLVNISSKRLVACGCGDWCGGSSLPPAVAPSSPSLHTAEALPSTPSLFTVEAPSSRVGHPFFSKELNVLAFFSVLYKRTQRS